MSSRSATLVGHLTVFLLLVVCLRVVGISGEEVSWIEAFAAWALIRILGALPLTPGGLGIVELGLSGALVAFGASNADAVAGNAAVPVADDPAHAGTRPARGGQLAEPSSERSVRVAAVTLVRGRITELRDRS